jgi:serine/threonine-protein kinase
MRTLSEAEAFAEVGSVLAGKYRIERIIGSGGMGVVVAAEHVQLGERVAIKFLLPQGLGNKTLIARFKREARAASRIRSAHVARVFDVDVRPNGAPYIVMEYLEGRTLAAAIQEDGALPVPLAVDLLLEACEPIAEAHVLGIVHRDLKPANLFLARGAGSMHVLKVLDFGISKMLDADDPGQHTSHNAFMGSPPYMSPEQLTVPSAVDCRTDIWALGVILTEMISGTSPFVADSVAETCARVLHKQPRPLADVARATPVELSHAVERCLAKDRERRLGSVIELARLLAPFGSPRARRSLEVVEAIASDAAAKRGSANPAPSRTALPDSTVAQDTLTAAATIPGATRPPQPMRRGVFVLSTVGGLLAVIITIFVLRDRNRAVVPPPDSEAPGAKSAVAQPMNSAVVSHQRPAVDAGAAATLPAPAASMSAAPQRARRRNPPASVPPLVTGSAGAPSRSDPSVYGERR